MAMTQNPIIDIQGLTKVFRGNDDPAVNGIDLQIFQNEIFGLLGPQWRWEDHYYFNALRLIPTHQWFCEDLWKGHAK